MFTNFLEIMKLSPAIVITIAVMVLLMGALILLAFFLGNQFAVARMVKSFTPITTSTSTPTKEEITIPTITLPEAPNSWSNLDMWLRGTVLRAAPLRFGEAVTLAINNATTERGAVAERNELYLYFVDVVYDSRCPENVDCGVAGEAIIEAQIQAFGKPTKTIYLSTQTSGRPDRWTYHGLQDKSAITPEIEAAIARGQKIITETTYVKGEAYNSGSALVDGYNVSLRGLTPSRVHEEAGTPVIPKENYRAMFIITKSPT